MSAYRENLDLLNRKMGPLNPKREYSLLDAVKDKPPVKAPEVTAPVVWKSAAAGGQKQPAATTDGGTAAKTTPSWRAPVYTSKHQKAMDDAVVALRAVKPFAYDPESDPLFHGYKETYTREGKRAMQDTIGEVSARTGGLASSYATSAAQQVNNSYMQQLADKIPQLQEMAYRMYRDRVGDLRADVDLYGGLEDRDRSRFEGDRSFGYGVHRDQVADERYADELAYGRGRDALADQRYDDERAYERGQDAIGHGWDVYNATGRADALGAAMGLDEATMQALIDTYARKKDLEEGQAAREIADWYVSHGDLSKLKEMGLDTSYDKAQIDAAKRQAALKGVGSSGSSGGSRKSGGSGGSGTAGTSLAREAITWAAQTGGDPEDYIKANYKKKGYTSKDAAVSALNVYLTENPEWDPSKLSGQMLGKFQAGIDAIKAGEYVPAGGASDSEFAAVKDSLRYYLNNGMDDKAGELVEQHADDLTDDQISELLKILNG